MLNGYLCSGLRIASACTHLLDLWGLYRMVPIATVRNIIMRCLALQKLVHFGTRLTPSAGGRAAQVCETGSPAISLSWACFRIEMLFASLREGGQATAHDSIDVAL
jgi:hypothetical protein